MDQIQENNIARIANVLGYLGVVPFIVFTIGLWIAQGTLQEISEEGVKFTGAVVLAFLGGIHWGAAMYKVPPHKWQMMISVLPGVLAWMALLLPTQIGYMILLAGLAGQWLVDRELENEGWFIKLRSSLTIIAVLCLALAEIRLLAF